MTTFDAVLVGSGINTLTAGALLARDGWSVCVLEQADRLGGAIRTERDYTLPGFTHEVMSSWHPLFQGSAAYAELADDLHGRGLEYVNTELPTGTAFPDGSAMFLGTSLEANVAEFDRVAEGDGAAWQRQFEEFMAQADLSFGVLGTELWSGSGSGCSAVSGGAGSSSSPVTRSVRAATGHRRRSARSRRTGFSPRGCCTPASGRTTRSRAS